MVPIHVAAAVIRDQQGQILLAKRPDDKHQGGLWEFPGGKVEAGETVEQALSRELFEELGIRPTAARPLIQVRHAYPDKNVLLDVWEVSEFEGTAHGAEGQALAWVGAKQLSDYEFPAANQPIVAAAKLPDQYLITPEGLTPKELLNGVHRAVERGVRLLALRAPEMFDAQYRDLAVDVMGLCAGKAQVMLKGPLEWLGDFPAAGWHLSAQQLRKYTANGRPFPKERWLAASCHNAQELALAAQMGVDFVTLSPVQATLTHPDTTPLGWDTTAELLTQFNQPTYLLGGMSAQDCARAWQVGAQGIAAIRSLWPEV